MKITVFAIKKNRKYLQGFEVNENYKKSVRAIQSDAHIQSEFKPVWGDLPCWMDVRTTSGYLRDLAFNIAHGDEKISKLVIEVGEE